MLKPKQEMVPFINVISQDNEGKPEATFRLKVDESTPGAIRRDWESADKKSSGTKWELQYESISGLITGVEFLDGDYGKNLILEVTDGEESHKVSLSTASAYGEDMMKKLPSLDISKPVELRPFSFIDETSGKNRKGMTVTQDGKKVQNFFYDFHEKKNINDFPNPKFGKGKTTLSKDEWKAYFLNCRIFLTEYVETHHLKASNNPLDESAKDRAGVDKLYEDMGEDVDPKDIPF